MVDMVVHRHQLRETLARLARLLMNDIAALEKKAHPEVKSMNGSAHHAAEAGSDAIDTATAPAEGATGKASASANRAGSANASAGGKSAKADASDTPDAADNKPGGATSAPAAKANEKQKTAGVPSPGSKSGS